MRISFSTLAAALLAWTTAAAQQPAKINMQAGRGLQFISPDSTFTLALTGRIQSMFEARHDRMEETTGADFLLRRCRLNFQGTAFHPSFSYRIQLGFSANDISAANSAAQNNLILRDAMLFYAPATWLRLGFGQTKLPGNRQRLVSSASLQLVERSITNNAFNIDRDKGFWIYTQFEPGHMLVKGTFAVSAGEGRIASNSNGKLCYSARAELMPFGGFTAGGDLTEADNERETQPKLSLAGVFSYNEATPRTMGQLGDFLFNSVVSNQLYAGGDFLFKYRGVSLEGEYYVRTASTGIITNEKDTTRKNYVMSGTGLMLQGGCFITRGTEVAARYARITPDNDIATLAKVQEEYAIGCSYYFRKHNLKLQNDISLFKNGADETLVYRLSGVVTF